MTMQIRYCNIFFVVLQGRELLLQSFLHPTTLSLKGNNGQAILAALQYCLHLLKTIMYLEVKTCLFKKLNVNKNTTSWYPGSL